MRIGELSRRVIMEYWYVLKAIDNYYGFPGATAFRNREDAYKYCIQEAKNKLLENNFSVKYFLLETKEDNDCVIWTITNEYESVKNTVYLPKETLIEYEKNTNASSFEISIKLAHNKD